ncbi:MAG: pleC 2 [Candidatus Doudnabacteria bacterium]|nr:pleC 2 [Candidatus Doudnabacteria bacterium]
MTMLAAVAIALVFPAVLPKVIKILGEAHLSLERKVALEAARKAARQKTDFMAMMSHELRTPLNSIVGFCSLIEDQHYGPVTEEQRIALVRIKDSSSHLVKLVRQILDYNGQERADWEEVELVTFCKTVLAMFDPLLGKYTVCLEVELPEVPYQVWTDTKKLRQVITNLLQNAFKFTEHGSVGFRVSCVDGLVSIEVSDTGIGISKENLAKIFDPFWQVDRRNMRAEAGAGLGLSITQRFVEILQGDIKAQSVLGKGTKFTVLLPQAPDKA